MRKIIAWIPFIGFLAELLLDEAYLSDESHINTYVFSLIYHVICMIVIVFVTVLSLQGVL